MRNRLKDQNPENRDLSKMPKVKGSNGQMVYSMLVRMRCESCLADHRMLVPEDMDFKHLPDVTKQTFRCNCKRGIPTITKMDRSLMSINGIPLAQLKALTVAKNPHAPKGALN